MAIQSFKDKETAAAFSGLPVKSLPPDIRKRTLSKLQHLNVALTLNDLRVPLGNRLEALVKDRQGQHSIRVNKQWRLCFRWTHALRMLRFRSITSEEKNP